MNTPISYDHLPGYATRWKALIFIGLSVIIMSMDNTILNNALPAISADLKANNRDLPWIVDSYLLVFAALMLTMGAVGDRFGRKRTLQAGLILFGLGSLAGALAHTTGALIAARAFLGIGAATIMPATLSLISATFPPQERPQAIAIWAAIFSLGVGIGPPLGGLLVQLYSWNAVFLINIPVILIALTGSVIYLAESKNETAPRPDIPGVILSILGLFALIYAIIEAGALGWGEPIVLLTFAVAFVLLALFAWWENRYPYAMLPISFFKNMSFTGANIVLAFTMFSLFGSMFFISQYLQTVLGFSPLDAGIRVLPAAIPMTIAATYSARVAARVGTKYTVALGIGTATLALLYMAAFYHVDTPYHVVIVGQIMLGTGLGLAVSPATNSIMGSIPVRKSGVGSAMNNTIRQLGGALGVAVLGTIMNANYLISLDSLKEQLPPQSFEAITSSIQQAHRFAAEAGLSTLEAENIVKLANQAFVNGMNRAIFVGAIIMGLTALLTLIVLPANVRPPEEINEPGPENIAAVSA